MAVLTTEALIIKWQARFADNVTREIDEGDFREFTQDVADSFSSVFGGPSAIEWLDPCLVATTADITLSGEQTIDGVLTSASRVLVKNQSTASQNGIYISAAGAWSRATDADSADELEGAAVGVTSGDTLINSSWIQTASEITIGVTDIVWHQIGFGVSSQNLEQVLTQGNSAGALTIEDLADPVNDQDAATKFYVDNLGVGLIDLEDLPKNTIEEVTATSYVFVNEDHLKIKKFTNASGCTATIPIGLDEGWSTTVYRAPGAGTLTLNSVGEYQGTDNTIGTEKGWASIVHLGDDVHAASGALGTLGLTIGTIDSQTKSSNGLVISSSSVYTQTADASSPGMVSTSAQTIAGAKTFSSTPIISATPSTSNTGNSILARNTNTGELELRSDVVVTSGAQTIGGVKTFSSTPLITAVPSTSDSGNSVLARNSTTGALELRSDVVISSGTYTPTLTNITNVSASTAYVCQYMRVGSTVTVSGRVQMDPVASASLTYIEMTLPIASDFTDSIQCAGTCTSTDATIFGAISGSSGNNKADIYFKSIGTSAVDLFFHYTYRVI